jgi:hypothetical protein
MSQFTVSKSPPDSLIDRYFWSWRSHDLSMLSAIFSSDATYSIEGKSTIAGIAGIEAYWKRNALRQVNLQVTHRVLAEQERSGSAIFLATFYDQEERQWQSVAGTIDFVFTEAKSRISALSEAYLKQNYLIAPIDVILGWMGERASKILNRVYLRGRRIHSSWTSLKEFLRNISIGLSYFFFILMVFLAGLLYFNPSDSLVFIAVSVFDTQQLSGTGLVTPAMKADALQKARDLMMFSVGVFGTVLSVIVPIIQIRARERLLERSKSLSIRDLMPGEDLEMLTAAYNGAERIVVFSGDFSFLRVSASLRRSFELLSRENKITLVSSKSEEEVAAQLRDLESTSALFDSLKAANHILFDNGIDIKCSLIENRKRTQFLYKYPTGEIKGPEYRMCTLRHTDESFYLLEALKVLVNNFVLELKKKLVS